MPYWPVLLSWESGCSAVSRSPMAHRALARPLVERVVLFKPCRSACLCMSKPMRIRRCCPTFVITPMAFLGGTFFPLDRLPVGLNMFWNSSLFPMRRKPCKPPLSDNPCVFFPAACFFLVPAPRLRGLSSVSGAHRDEPVRRALFLPHVGRVAFGTRRAFPQSLAAGTSLRI